MTPRNVETVRRGWEAWIAGDVDALFDTLDPEVEWDTKNFDGWPEGGVYAGKERVREFLRDWRAMWDNYEAGVENYVDLDGDRVLVLCWQRGFGHGSHAPVRMDWAQICTLDGGLVRRIEAYSDRRRAFELAGLTEGIADR